MPLMPVTDSMFLLGESREHPLHVGGLQLFELPEGADGDYVGDLHRALLTEVDIRPLFRRRPRGPVSTVGQLFWADDDLLDLEYHVRLSALPTPGRVRELLELVSRLHGSLLDRHRPLWESHLIEGLQGNRFAIYTKVHHALLDGVSALRVLQASLSTDPAERGMRPPWSPPVRTDAAAAPRARRDTDPLAAFAAGVRDVVGIGPAVAKYANQVFREQSATLPFEAPKSVFNVPITGARRFAAQGWPLARIRAVGEAAGATVNDVMLAMCAGALRQYLLELGALPDKPLVAAVPVSLRTDDGAGGNAVGLILSTLATDVPDPADRLALITESMRRGKEFYRGMSQLQVTALSAIPFAPLAVALVPGAVKIAPPAFNLLISNVPGPTEPLYWNGARMLGVYPVSVPYEGQALNITVTSYNGSLEFGLTGCRRTVPHLQRLLGHLDAELLALEERVLG
ncbi:wax ester/triacylglycerol synthase family O-acyltransferase [Actinokineospora sp. NBRC 105648]|uniref:WS/DGAT/MGAT family O-acyltransferase n=1 Tax=Actinokineospora sp. NBRC 105648 TaxID=3032206 RepID=UPI0024A5456F|nr:wax ester/triacylglycerol synthase family O-acyltransferase [Actinokineospora sp. NBRC 105648]GLZ42433.1 diacylglycerol O-acyltransferase [Actinokineospora sp. NBRC 105648]